MILNKSVVPCNGEVSVKSYLCTSFGSMLFGIKADGYLEITNKRLLFQANGAGTIQSKSVIHSEVPISEVVGINIYRGKGFNLLRLILGMVILAFIISVIGAVFMGVLAGLRDSPVAYQFIIWALAAGSLYLAYMYRDGANDSVDNSLKELALSGISLAFLAILVQGSMGYYNSLGSGKFATITFLAVAIFALFRYSKKPAFSLFIQSKSSANSIVRISGPSPMGAANSAASKALTAKPGRDSLLVMEELGALIHDLQNMGEDALDKWKNK